MQIVCILVIIMWSFELSTGVEEEYLTGFAIVWFHDTLVVVTCLDVRF